MKTSRAAIERAAELANEQCIKAKTIGRWSAREYSKDNFQNPAIQSFIAFSDYVQKVSDIAERRAQSCMSDKDRYEALQELVVKDIDPVEEIFGKDGTVIGFPTDAIRKRIEAFGYKLVKDE